MGLIAKYNTLSVQVKATLWFVVCSVLQKGLSLITVPLFTRLMPQEAYGAYNVYLSWFSIISVFSSFNLHFGVFNNAMMKYEKDRNRYVSSMQGLTITLTAILFFVYILFHDFWNRVLEMSTLMVCLLFIELLVSPMLLLWSARQRYEYQYKALVGITLLKSILNPLLGLIAVLISDQKDIARIASVVIVEFLLCGVVGVYQFAKGKSFFSKKYWKYAFFFNFPLIPHYLSGMILNQGDRIMIGKMVGDSEVAIYSIAYSIGMLLMLFTEALNSSFTPWMYRKLQEKAIVEIRKTASLLFLFLAFVVIGLMFFVPEILIVFASPEYGDAVAVVPSVAASVFFVFMYCFFINIEYYFEKNIFIMVASIAAAVLNIILNALFIPLLGYTAAAYTTLICYIMFSFSHFVFSRVVCLQNGIKKAVFDFKVILILSVIVIGASMIFPILYQFSILRYLLAAVLVIIMFFKRKVFLSTILKLRQH